MKNVIYLLEVIFAAMRKLSTLLVKTINDTHISQKVVDKILKPLLHNKTNRTGNRIRFEFEL
jgi:hypothetical protein